MDQVENFRSLARVTSFFQAVQDDDCFTIFWELAEYSPKPVPFESIRKTFGADPHYLTKVLDRLRQLGIAKRSGRHWTVCDWAKASLDYLEKVTADTEVLLAQTASSGVQVHAANPVSVATYDGFWVGVTSHVSGRDSILTGGARTASAKELTDLKSPEFNEKSQNETRSHDYK